LSTLPRRNCRVTLPPAKAPGGAAGLSRRQDDKTTRRRDEEDEEEKEEEAAEKILSGTFGPSGQKQSCPRPKKRPRGGRGRRQTLSLSAVKPCPLAPPIWPISATFFFFTI
jgi:hypothetical protein